MPPASYMTDCNIFSTVTKNMNPPNAGNYLSFGRRRKKIRLDTNAIGLRVVHTGKGKLMSYSRTTCRMVLLCAILAIDAASAQVSVTTNQSLSTNEPSPETNELLSS